MADYFLKKTVNTPQIQIDSSEGYIGIEGRAIPEDPGDFFDKFIKHLDEYYKSPRILTTFDFKLEYVNSGSSKFILEILRNVKRNYDAGHDCLVNWYYEEDDESMQELGLHYQTAIKVPFKMVEYY
jgi:hypothetical protein